jgi:hypothetical protein
VWCNGVHTPCQLSLCGVMGKWVLACQIAREGVCCESLYEVCGVCSIVHNACAATALSV